MRKYGDRIRDHLRSNLVGYLALFIALSGTAWAASRIDTPDIAKHAVTKPKVAPDAIRSGKVDDGSLTGEDLADDSVTGLQVDESTLDLQSGAPGPAGPPGASGPPGPPGPPGPSSVLFASLEMDVGDTGVVIFEHEGIGLEAACQAATVQINVSATPGAGESVLFQGYMAPFGHQSITYPHGTTSQLFATTKFTVIGDLLATTGEGLAITLTALSPGQLAGQSSDCVISGSGMPR